MALTLALIMAALAGFSIHRGTLCAVQAADEAVTQQRWGRFVSFVECSGWVVILLAAVSLLSGDWRFHAVNAWVGWMPLVGGMLFGIGALINGGCAFGTVARLAGGDLSYLASFVAFSLAILVASSLASPAMPMMSRPEIAAGSAWLSPLWLTALAILAAGFFVRNAALPIFRRGPGKLLAQAVWPPSLAVMVIALCNVGVLLVTGFWLTSIAAIELTTSGPVIDIRLLLLGVLIAGAGCGALSAGRFKLIAPGPQAWLRRLLGGAGMGLGAACIPGGNDILILRDLPQLELAGVAAFISMNVTLLAVIWLQNSLRPTTQAATGTDS